MVGWWGASGPLEMATPAKQPNSAAFQSIIWSIIIRTLRSTIVQHTSQGLRHGIECICVLEKPSACIVLPLLDMRGERVRFADEDMVPVFQCDVACPLQKHTSLAKKMTWVVN
jgi:hypothetical protein